MKELKKNTLIFIILIGLVSLFSDMTHEGAKSIYGPFLALTGASPSLISIIGGLGEFVGTALIFVTSLITNKTKNYWTMTIIGYTIDLFSIPLLCLTSANGYIYAIGLILLEKVGKAIRKPAKNTIVSFTSKNIGYGKSFAIIECLDQIGAFLGPLMLSLILYLKNTSSIFSSYKFCFFILFVPATLALIILLYTSYKYPTPDDLEVDFDKNVNNKISFNKGFICYLIAISLIGFSFVDFPLISLHISNINVLDIKTIPLLFSLAMLVDSLSALVFGTLFDHIGLKTLIISTILSMCYPLFIFNYNNIYLLILGVICWGIGMGAIESILKSSVSKLSTKDNRSKCFGIFEGLFGLSWFIGSVILGFIYESNIIVFITLPIILQIIAILFYIFTIKYSTKTNVIL